jgi:tetratricopeptide (TPR) repeat protein
MEKESLSGKLAVILHADVAGSTALVQEDKRLAHERIQGAFKRFNRPRFSPGAMGFGVCLLVVWRVAKVGKSSRAIGTLAPNFADGWGLLAPINNNLDRGDQALRFIRKGMALNPAYPWDYLYNEGRAYYTMSEYELAVEPLLLAI